MSEISEDVFAALLELDTPTICNALEVVNPERRAQGFNVRPFLCAHPDLPPVLGYARTARMRSTHKPTKPQDRDGYYSYIAEGGPVPSIVVVEDIDEIAGYGAMWGEVNTNVHYGLGCKGVVTNGSMRDIPDARPEFQMLAGMVNPSHGWFNLIDWGMTVNVHGLEVSHGDLVHADRHGAVVIPADDAEAVIEEAKRIAAREHLIVTAAKQPGFNMEKLREAWKGMADIH
jgi:regulator of RNase E activity RraA